MRSRAEFENVAVSAVLGAFVAFWVVSTVFAAWDPTAVGIPVLGLAGGAFALTGSIPWCIRNVSVAKTRLVLRAAFVTVGLVSAALVVRFNDISLLVAALAVAVGATLLSYAYVSSSFPTHSLLVGVWILGLAFCISWSLVTVELVVAEADRRLALVFVLVPLCLYGLHNSLIAERRQHFP